MGGFTPTRALSVVEVSAALRLLTVEGEAKGHCWWLSAPNLIPTSGSRPNRFAAVEGDAKWLSAPNSHNSPTSGGSGSRFAIVEGEGKFQKFQGNCVQTDAKENKIDGKNTFKQGGLDLETNCHAKMCLSNEAP